MNTRAFCSRHLNLAVLNGRNGMFVHGPLMPFSELPQRQAQINANVYRRDADLIIHYSIPLTEYFPFHEVRAIRFYRSKTL